MSWYMITCLLLCWSLRADGEELKFPKDLRTDKKFPPKFIKSTNAHIPTGHFRPFGHQRRTDGPVKQYTDSLDPQKFWEDHVSSKTPCVFRKEVEDSPAIKLWTDEYLVENYGDLDVLVELKVEVRPFEKKRMKIKDFLDGYMTEDWYVVSVLPDEMRGDIKVSKSIKCGTFSRLLQETNIWMSSGDTASVIHFDADHNIHCLLSGRKDFIMIHPQYEEFLYMADRDFSTGSGYSSLHVDRINMFKFSEVANAHWTWATILPGDCIYIPAEYLHQVRSYGRSISATILFTAEPEFDPTGCNETDLDKYTSLNDVRVMWTYKKGDKVIEIGYMNTEVLRENLLSIMGEDEKLNIEKFTLFFNHMKYDLDVEGLEQFGISDEVQKAFDILDSSKQGFLTRQDIKDLELEPLKNVVRMVDIPAGPNADEMEDEQKDEDEAETAPEDKEASLEIEDEVEDELGDGDEGDILDNLTEEEDSGRINLEEEEDEHHDHDEL